MMTANAVKLAKRKMAKMKKAPPDKVTRAA